MKHTMIWAVLAAVTVVITGCNTLSGQPAIRKAEITPPELKPGDSAVIRMEIKDKHNLVRRVEGVVVEDPRITFGLKDNGVDPDAKAGDGVWSMRVDVPFQAPPGQYMLEFTAYDANGHAISVREKGVVHPLQASMGLRITKTP